MKIKTTIETEVDVIFPSYKKGSCHFFKLISENLSISVTDSDIHSAITLIDTSVTFAVNTVECTEDVFLEGFNRVNNLLIKLTND